MAKRSETACRKRCTECRCYFTPTATAAKSQRVCGAACRKRRRRKLAKQRRESDVQGFRVDERARQRASRAKRRAEAPAPRPAATACHAPASSHKGPDLQQEVMDFWDGMQAASRATFKRALPAFLRRFERASETRAGP